MVKHHSKVIKLQGGGTRKQYYKTYKNGGTKRILKEEYLKKTKKQSGGSTTPPSTPRKGQPSNENGNKGNSSRLPPKLTLKLPKTIKSLKLQSQISQKQTSQKQTSQLTEKEIKDLKDDTDNGKERVSEFQKATIINDDEYNDLKEFSGKELNESTEGATYTIKDTDTDTYKYEITIKQQGKT